MCTMHVCTTVFGKTACHAVSADTIERIIQTTLSPSPAGRTRWTTRLLGRKFGLTSWTVSKILRANELKPHLVRT